MKTYWKCLIDEYDGMPIAPENRGCGEVFAHELQPMEGDSPNCCPHCSGFLTIIVPATTQDRAEALGVRDYEIAARDLAEMVEEKKVTLDCVPVMETPFMDKEWSAKAKAAHVQCRVSAPSLKIPFIVHYSAGVGAWIPRVEKDARGVRVDIQRAKFALGKAKHEWHDYTQNQDLFDRARKAWKPRPVDVIESCLRDSDALGQGFDDWASELGYDPDSRKALAMFEECQRIGREMRALFGADFERARALVCEM